jgi:hypothetical protein
MKIHEVIDQHELDHSAVADRIRAARDAEPNMDRWNPKLGGLKEWFRAQGYQMIGEGRFSVVFVRPGAETVVKVSKQDDRCWLAFAELAQQGQNNPSFPRITDLHRFKYNGEELFICQMEKLERVLSAPRERIQGFHAFINMMHDGGDYIGTNVLGNQRVMQSGPMASFARDNPGFLEAFREVEDLRERMGCGMDLHIGNFMYRPSTGSFVILDPLLI